MHIKCSRFILTCVSLSRRTLVTCLDTGTLSMIFSFRINLDFCLAGGHIQICQFGQQTCSQGKLNEGKDSSDGVCFYTGMHGQISLYLQLTSHDPSQHKQTITT